MRHKNAITLSGQVAILILTFHLMFLLFARNIFYFATVGLFPALLRHVDILADLNYQCQDLSRRGSYSTKVESLIDS